jgi:hypothetical protein
MKFNITHKPEPLAVPGFSAMIHLGAGPYFDNSYYDSSDVKKVVLVDGDAEICSDLRSASSPQSCFEIRNICLRPEEGPCSFYRFNFSAFNGPLPIGKLAGLYPGLQQISELRTEGVSLKTFLSEFQTQEEPVLLIFDLAGQELSLLRSLSFPILSAFPWVLLRGTLHPHQEGAASYQESKKFLQARGFAPVAAANGHESDSPFILFHLDKQSAENQLLKTEHHNLKEEAALLRKELAEHQNVATELQQSVQSAADLTQKVDSLVAERDGARKQCATLEKEKAEADNQIKALASEKEQLQAELDKTKTAHRLRQQELSRLKALVREKESCLLETKKDLSSDAEKQQVVRDQVAKTEARLSLLQDLLSSSLKL